MPRVKGRYQPFTDGLLIICEADERAIIGTKAEHIRFGNRTVGVTRYWQAQTAGNKIDKLLAIPLEITSEVLIEVHDIVVLENESDWLWGNTVFDENISIDKAGQYEILQIQPKYDAKPPALYLTLRKLVHPYKDGRQKP